MASTPRIHKSEASLGHDPTLGPVPGRLAAVAREHSDVISNFRGLWDYEHCMFVICRMVIGFRHGALRSRNLTSE